MSLDHDLEEEQPGSSGYIALISVFLGVYLDRRWATLSSFWATVENDVLLFRAAWLSR